MKYIATLIITGCVVAFVSKTITGAIIVNGLFIVVWMGLWWFINSHFNLTNNTDNR